MERISKEELKELRSGEYIILDIREPDELRSGIIPGSIHIPMSQIASSLDTLDKEKLIVIYCRSGSRSDYLCQQLNARGYNTKSLLGGFNAYMH